MSVHAKYNSVPKPYESEEDYPEYNEDSDDYSDLENEGEFGLDETSSDYNDDEIPYEEELPGGEGGLTDVTRDQILQLLTQVESGAKPADPESKMTTEAALQILQDALKEEDAGDDAKSLEKYLEVQEVFDIDDSTLFGQTHSKFENGTYYFDGTEEEPDFSLKAPGTGLTAEIKTEGEVVLTPVDKKDKVKIQEKGEFYIVTMIHEGKTDTFKVSKEAKLHIASDHVDGKVDLEDGNVTAGVDNPKKFIPEKTLKEIASLISDSAGMVGYATYTAKDYDDGDSFLPDWLDGGAAFVTFDTAYDTKISSKYAVGYRDQGDPTSNTNAAKKEVADVKELLGSMGEALEEKDPKDKAEKWDEALDLLSRFSSQNESGHANNRCALLFNVIHGELGDEQFEFALSEGLIPKEFVSKWSFGLTLNGEETTNTDKEVAWQSAGGESTKWTHRTKADFLDKHAGTGTSGEITEGDA